MRVLFTNHALSARGGSELWLRDAALALLARGHQPVVYSPLLGEVAAEIRSHGVPVVADIAGVGQPPDLIHGHHHLETMTALAQFPGTTAIFVCHGWLPWQEEPPRHPRIGGYVAVDEACRDRLTIEARIPPDRVSLLLNFADPERFRRLAPLSPSPRRALVYSNLLAPGSAPLAAIEEACRRVGCALDVAGRELGGEIADPHLMLGRYDLVFAKGRSAIEALIAGAAVIPCDAAGAGHLVTTANLEAMRLRNFGLRALNFAVEADHLEREIRGFDAADAAAVTARMRVEAALAPAMDALIAIYARVLSAPDPEPSDPDRESRALATYLQRLNPRVRAAEQIGARAARVERALIVAEERADRAESALTATTPVPGALLAAIASLRTTSERADRELAEAGRARERLLALAEAAALAVGGQDCRDLLARFPVVRGAGLGWLDHATGVDSGLSDLAAGESVLLSGWAVDGETRLPALAVWLIAAGRILGVAVPGEERADVAVTLKAEACRRSGFSLLVPAAALPPGPELIVSALALLSDGRRLTPVPGELHIKRRG